MVFNTPEFFIFFAIVVGLYYVFNHRWQNILLVGSSYVFYSFWDWRFCGLLAISTILDWYCGLKIPGPNGKKWLYASVIGQLGMLGFFKYFNFFEEAVRQMFLRLGWAADWWTLKVVLPVGISFYTFQTLSYTIDIWRGKLKPVRSLMDFAVFVSFWPHLVAGPILRASFLLPQILERRKVTMRDWGEGTYFILVGLVKKVAVADVIVTAIEHARTYPMEYSSWQLVLTCYLFAIRVYCDFSGYTDIARGASMFMGFRLQENFRWPYFSAGISEFWRRWHISLSSWLRDYVYISLGGNRGGTYQTYRNLMITMALCGLWHGPTWNYVLWGTINGVFLSIGRMIGKSYDAFVERLGSMHLRPVWLFLVGLFTFQLMSMSHMFAILPGLPTSFDFFYRIFEFTFKADPDRQRLVLYAMAVVLAIDVPEALHRRHEYLLDKPFWVRGLVYSCFIALIAVTWTNNYEPFFYFQF
ncbi:MAG: MBOAT family O-acyltransferase [Candidatus Sumerlaeaceae bacterium]